MQRGRKTLRIPLDWGRWLWNSFDMFQSKRKRRKKSVTTFCRKAFPHTSQFAFDNCHLNKLTSRRGVGVDELCRNSSFFPMKIQWRLHNQPQSWFNLKYFHLFLNHMSALWIDSFVFYLFCIYFYLFIQSRESNNKLSFNMLFYF